MLSIENESVHFGRTLLEWARRFDENREAIVGRWGERLYWAFRLYLWGGSQAFPELIQACHLVPRRTEHKPAIPGRLRRLVGWVGR